MSRHFDFAGGDAAPFAAELLGTQANGLLLVAMEPTVLARAVEEAAFHLEPGVTGAVGDELLDPTAPAARVRLRSVAGHRPPDDLDAKATAAWLADPSIGRDAADWLVTDWTVGDVRHRTAWDYLPADPADASDPVAGALQFILDGHPELPAGLADVGRMLAQLTPPTGSTLDEVAAVLAGMGVRSDLLNDDGPLGFTMQSDAVDGELAESWNCLADELPDSWLVIYSDLPVSVAEADLARAMSVTARINGELQHGALLIDATGDTVMYRAASYLGPAPARAAAIGRLLEVVHTDTQACLAQWSLALADES